MKKIVLTDIALAAAVLFSIGMLTGCDYCQPFALASIIFMVMNRWLPTENKRTQFEYFAS